MNFIPVVVVLLVLVVFMFFKVRSDQIESFTTPIPVNVPAQNHLEGKNFLVGNNNQPKGEPIVDSDGQYEFRKEELLYDGIWGADYKYDHKGNERCDWENRSATHPLPTKKKDLIYAADTFFKIPKKCLFGKEICSPPDCDWNDMTGCKNQTYLEEYKKNRPLYCTKPTFEDVFGIVPQNNMNYSFKPPVLSNLNK